jgi:hypothetical protein
MLSGTIWQIEQTPLLMGCGFSGIFENYKKKNPVMKTGLDILKPRRF